MRRQKRSRRPATAAAGSKPFTKRAEKGARISKSQSPLTDRQILAWADAHFKRHGYWPLFYSGPVDGAPGESWDKINRYLQSGNRGLPRGRSLSRLILDARGVKVYGGPLRLSEEMILAWADAFFKKNGFWPSSKGKYPVPGAPHESWKKINAALRNGGRGLTERLTLFRFLQKHRKIDARKTGRPHHGGPALLTMKQIMAWAKAFRRKTGIWPHAAAGRVAGEDGLIWANIDAALRGGLRGLPGGTSLSRLFGRKKSRPRH